MRLIINGETADVIADYLCDDKNKFYGVVSEQWDALTGFFTGAGRYDYQEVVNILNYFGENFYHDAGEKAAYRRELGLRAKDITQEKIADIFQTAAFVYAFICADLEEDFFTGMEGVR